MPTQKKETPKTDNQPPSDPAAKDTPDQVPTPAAEFGSDPWYAARWESRFQAVKWEILWQQVAIIELAEAKFNQLKPVLAAHPGLPLDEHYHVLKYLELYEIAESLAPFFTEWFKFFRAGFYQPLNHPKGRVEQPSQNQEGDPVPKAGEDPRSYKLQKRIENAARTVFETIFSEPSLAPDRQPDAEQWVRMPSSYTDSLFYTSKKYPRNFVLSALIEQASHDLSLLQQIFAQRPIGKEEGIREVSVDTFLLAEALGRRALQPATASKLLDQRYRSVFCYLGSHTAVRLLPYHGSVLLGVPYGTNQAPQRLPKEYP